MPQRRTLKRIAAVTGATMHALTDPFSQWFPLMDFLGNTDYFDFTLADGRRWNEVSNEIVERLPQEARASLLTFGEWGTKRGVDTASMMDCVANVILWPLRPGSTVNRRYWSDQPMKTKDILRLIRSGIRTSKILLSGSTPERRSRKVGE